MLAIVCLAAFGGVPSAAPAQGGERLPPALRRALTASASLRYTGRRVVTVLRDGQVDRHEEIVLRDGPRLRIEFPSGGDYAGQVIVEDAKRRRHFLPATNEVRLLPPRREEGLQRLRALARGGRLTVAGGDRIAGIPTSEITVTDASGNVVQRLAIDPDSGLVLRRRLYDTTGTEIGGYAYTKVDLSPKPFAPGLFEIQRRGAKTVTPEDTLRRLAKRAGYPVVSLPESTGYRLDTVRLAKLPEGTVLVQNYVGPGGRLSLYQLSKPVDPARLRRQGRNLVRTLSWNAEGQTFVLIGSQDDATLARLKVALGS